MSIEIEDPLPTFRLQLLGKLAVISKMCGSPTAAARRIGVSKSTMHYWYHNRYPVMKSRNLAKIEELYLLAYAHRTARRLQEHARYERRKAAEAPPDPISVDAGKIC